ncbi:hypothetical protein [Amycolatopsis sp. GM8]|uniref:hypothetical protein n=1 Tax=Amycolatopsis sp. GM8 TaxID=2896530 RepID=UPI001F3707EB|nr:hypothetical protein [Amycolatopsis sp. GM8]
MRPRQEITYTDELLADGTVHRRYSDGRHEWRTRDASGRVHWRDDQGGTGTDEPLGRRMIKRTTADGSVRYGKDLGFGRTAWSDNVLTTNRTSFGGRVGAILAAVGIGATIAAIELPPAFMSPEEEEQLRQQAQASASQSSGDGGSGVSWETDSDDDHFG